AAGAAGVAGVAGADVTGGAWLSGAEGFWAFGALGAGAPPAKGSWYC
ncbi:MAG: hypothetical protein JWO74_4612, partial [Solirubrobacterales bacterium]|nr:hypothetical protein [Solirubrobacterales bacterium]